MELNILQPREINHEQFNLFRKIIYQESGINLHDSKMALVQSRLMKRLRALKINDYNEYYDFLINNYENEIVNLLNCITTNKTDFFRENKHFEFIQDVALPEIDKRNQKNITIWSAGCSTGQEPYSIAITIFDHYLKKKIPMPEIKILATDIDTNVLNVATEGVYKEDEFEDVDTHLLRKFFLKGKDDNVGHFKVKEYVKKIIYFKRLNLRSEKYPMRGNFDFLFCRNVIIYFDNDTRKKIFDKFYNYLSNDGYFFAGHSEHIGSFTDKFKLHGNTIYTKAK